MRRIGAATYEDAMFQIPPALWPEIEDSVMRLLLDAYDAGMRRGLGSGRAGRRPSPHPPATAWMSTVFGRLRKVAAGEATHW